jgi:hypothetical protein
VRDKERGGMREKRRWRRDEEENGKREENNPLNIQLPQSLSGHRYFG